MKFCNSTIKLARIFQNEMPVESVRIVPQLFVIGKICKAFVISISVFIILGQMSKLQADEWKEVHSSEVDRVFQDDQLTESRSLAMVEWDISKSNPTTKPITNSNAQMAHSQSSFKYLNQSIGTNSSNTSPYYNLTNSKSKYPYCSDGVSHFQMSQSWKTLLQDVSYTHFENSKLIPFHMNSHFTVRQFSLLNCPVKELIFSRNCSAYSLLQKGRDYVFYRNNFIDVLNLEKILISSNDRSSQFSINLQLTNAHTANYSGTQLMVERELTVLENPSVLGILGKRMDRQYLFYSQAASSHEKHIVRNENRKILSLWHPNLKELHSVNCSMRCEDYPLRSMITRSARDWKFFC